MGGGIFPAFPTLEQDNPETAEILLGGSFFMGCFMWVLGESL
jgi:hypothetical protein